VRLTLEALDSRPIGPIHGQELKATRRELKILGFVDHTHATLAVSSMTFIVKLFAEPLEPTDLTFTYC
jgi:hypothetical protein